MAFSWNLGGTGWISFLEKSITKNRLLKVVVLWNLMISITFAIMTIGPSKY